MGSAERLLEPPAAYLGVMPRHEHRRHHGAVVHLGPRVVRTVQQTVHERILLYGVRIAQRARQLPHHAIDQDHRRQLAAREHVVADADLVIHVALDQPLVHPFVATGDQDEPAMRRERHHLAMIQHLALRRQIDHPGILSAAASLPLPGGLDRSFERRGEHHHAGPAAKRPIVHGPVRIGREVPRVPRHQVPQPLIAGAARDAEGGHRFEHLRKDADYVHMEHAHPAP